MFNQRRPHRFLRTPARAARLAGLADATGLGWLEQFEPRLVLAINPSAEEQFMMELLNRFRTDPQGELNLLTNSLSGEARSEDPDINSALDFFNVSGPVLQSQWASLSAVPALAWNEALYEMAELQSQNMILDDMQEHNLPGRPGLAARADLFDYQYTILGENIFAYAESVFHGHAAFAIDWGSGPSGIQNPPGHRQSMLSSQFREVGIRIIPEVAQATEVGPLVMTQNFGTRQDFGDSWLLGVVFDDVNTNEFYGVGEGLSGVTVTAVSGNDTFVATTFTAGGYQMQLPQGTYTVTFSGGSFGNALIVQDVVIGSTNAKLDAIAGQASPTPLIKVLGNGVAIGGGDSTPDIADHTAFGSIDIEAVVVVRTFTVRNDGTLALDISGDPRVVIADDSFGVFTLTLDLSAATIEPGGELTFQVTFDPDAVGTYGATITITSDDVSFPEFRFTIEGVATATPDVGVLGNGSVAILDGSTEPQNANGTTFGQRNVIGETNDREFVIQNTGTAPLVLSGLVTLAGRNPQDFRIVVQPAATTLAPGETTTILIRFNPGRVGVRNAIVRFDSDDPDTGTFDFAIRGTGVGTPIIKVRGKGEAIDARDDTPSRDDGTNFSSMHIRRESKLNIFGIRNVGRDRLILTAPARIRITGAHAEDFRLVRLPTVGVGAGSMTSFGIRFNPSAVGKRTAWVAIPTNDPATPVYTFRISGVGVRGT